MGCCSASREEFQNKENLSKSPILFEEGSFTILDKSMSIRNMTSFEELVKNFKDYAISEAYYAKTTSEKNCWVLAGSTSKEGAEIYLSINYERKGFFLVMGSRYDFPKLSELIVEEVHFPGDGHKIKLVDLLRFVYEQKTDIYAETEEKVKGTLVFSYIKGNA